MLPVRAGLRSCVSLVSLLNLLILELRFHFKGGRSLSWSSMSWSSSPWRCCFCPCELCGASGNPKLRVGLNRLPALFPGRTSWGKKILFNFPSNHSQCWLGWRILRSLSMGWDLQLEGGACSMWVLWLLIFCSTDYLAAARRWPGKLQIVKIQTGRRRQHPIPMVACTLALQPPILFSC